MYEVGFYRTDADEDEDGTKCDLWVVLYRSASFEEAEAELEALNMVFPNEALELVS